MKKKRIEEEKRRKGNIKLKEIIKRVLKNPVAHTHLTKNNKKMS